MIYIGDLDKAVVLAALYNNARPLGLGSILARQGDMTIEEAARELETSTRFDYLHGRVMKIDLCDTTFDPNLYDRDLGEGAAQRVIDEVRTRMSQGR